MAAETTIATGSAEQTRALGAALGAVLAAGDLVMLSGGLGAGKTTLAQGIGEGMGVLGRVASPTFIIARVHPSGRGGPDLVHADAYRIRDLEDLETLDLDSSLDEAVTVVEWGEGKTEALSDSRLEIEVRRPHGAVRTGAPQSDDAPAVPSVKEPVVDLGEVDDGSRWITVRALGPRWAQADLDPLAAGTSSQPGASQ